MSFTKVWVLLIETGWTSIPRPCFDSTYPGTQRAINTIERRAIMKIFPTTHNFKHLWSLFVFNIYTLSPYWYCQILHWPLLQRHLHTIRKVTAEPILLYPVNFHCTLFVSVIFFHFWLLMTAIYLEQIASLNKRYQRVSIFLSVTILENLEISDNI